MRPISRNSKNKFTQTTSSRPIIIKRKNSGGEHKQKHTIRSNLIKGNNRPNSTEVSDIFRTNFENCYLGTSKTGSITWPVVLRIYDITSGKAARWSKFVLGKSIKGVWHTGLVVYGFEYSYGDGITKMRPSEAVEFSKMTLCYELYMGSTTISKSEFEQ